MARSWGNLADDAEYAKSRIASLLGDGAIGAWIGEAGEAFRDKTGDLPEQLGQCCESYRLASEALTWWAGRLEGHQHDADRALVLGRAAREDLEQARQRASAAAAAATAAGNVGVLSPTAVEPDPARVREATQRLHAAQAASSAADGDVAAAQSRLDAARQMALDAKGLRESDGRTAAGRIHDASDAGIPERSRWEKFKDWAGEAWDVIVKIAKVVVAVLGVVALIIGGPLAWVVFAAALLVLADTIMKYMQGKASLWDVAFAAISCIPGTKGLTTLAELRTAFQAGGLLGAGLHVLSAGKTALVEMAQGIRALGSGLRTSMVGLLDRGLVRLDTQLLNTRFADSWMDVRSVVHRLRGGSFTDSGDLIIRRWTPAGEPGPLGTGFPADTFRSMTYDEVMLRDTTTLNRVIADGGNPRGLFWTADAPTGPLESQLNLALKPEWNVQTVDGVTTTLPQATHTVTADFPAGTTVFQGPTAPQFSDGISTVSNGHTNVSIPGSVIGGGEQIVPHPYFMRQWQNAVNDATASMPGEVPQVDIDMNLQGPFPVGGS
jgi:hypothetical protein